jgi:hypothetical protein
VALAGTRFTPIICGVRYPALTSHMGAECGRRVSKLECSLIAAWKMPPRGARRWPASRPSLRAAAVFRLFVTILTAI